MKNLSKRLEDLEIKIIETKNDKQRLREKVEKREKEAIYYSDFSMESPKDEI